MSRKLVGPACSEHQLAKILICSTLGFAADLFFLPFASVLMNHHAAIELIHERIVTSGRMTKTVAFPTW